MPETTIITPTFNRAALLPQLTQTVAAQTYRDFEWIIVDDGSTDNTEELVRRQSADDPDRIRFLRQTNQGSGAARNAGIAQARGKYVAFLDSDDTWRPDYLAKTIGALQSGRYHWVVTAAEKVDIDAQGNEAGRSLIRCDWSQRNTYFGRELSLFEGLLTGNVLGETSRVVVTRQALQVVGGFRRDLRLSQDYELWLRLARENYFLKVIDEPLVVYRKSVDSVTKTRFVEALKYGYRIINEYSREAVALDPLFARFYAEKMRGYARDAWRGRDVLFVTRCLINALKFRWIYQTKRQRDE